MTDLFFLVQIGDIAKRAGYKVKFLKDRETVLENIGTNPSAVIFDLNCAALDPISLIRYIKGDPATAHIATIAFVSHVQVALKQEAEESGCDVVLARSAFAQKLPEILKSLATA